MDSKEPNSTKGRGGSRPGAGRPATDSKLYSVRLPGDVARHIDSQPNKSDYIKSCIVRDMAQDASGPAGIAEDVFRCVGKTYHATQVKDIALPVFDIEVVAGFPIPLDNDERSQNIELLQLLCPHPESCYLIKVKGDSMIDADIHPGDIIIVDKDNRTPGPHDVAMCELNGEYTIKYFEREQDHAWLIPANPDYPKLKVTSADDFHIWGVISYVIHKPKRG